MLCETHVLLLHISLQIIMGYVSGVHVVWEDICLLFYSTYTYVEVPKCTSLCLLCYFCGFLILLPLWSSSFHFQLSAMFIVYCVSMEWILEYSLRLVQHCHWLFNGMLGFPSCTKTLYGTSHPMPSYPIPPHGTLGQYRPSRVRHSGEVITDS